MSDENNKSDDGDKAKDKVEATKKPAVAKKKAKAKSNSESKADASNNKVIEKLQAMGVMSDGSSTKKENSKHEKGELLKIVTASLAAVLVVGSFVWALNKEAVNERAASDFNNIPAMNQQAMQSNYPTQWGQPSMYGNPAGNNVAFQEKNRKYREMQQQRTKQHREQQQKWMEQQQAQRQKWVDQQKQTQAQYQTQQQKWMNEQRAQAFQQHPTQQQFPAQQQKWIEQQRAQKKFFQDQQLAQQKRLQEQQRAQQQKWREQAYNSYPPQMNYQGQTVTPPAYNNVPGYQQPAPYKYYGR